MGCFSSKVKVTLHNATLLNTKPLSYCGNRCMARVLDVYDGDTITIAIEFEGKIRQERCRLLNIDTPEIRTKDLEEKSKGLFAKNFLKEQIYNRIVEVECGDWDKYGRLLVTVILDGINVNELLIQQGLAVRYDGGTKNKSS